MSLPREPASNSATVGPVAVIGAGPSGLTAALVLSRAGVPVTVIEADSHDVGGISRSVRYRSPAAGGLEFRFDIGGHRFFSKSREIEDLWTDLLGNDMLERPRLSRILYGGKFYDYPLSPLQAIRNLGLFESIRCVASYLHARAFPVLPARSFEDWVSNQFGRRLFEIFFRTYTEKVWGMKCSEISADWAAQRIKGLSLGAAIRHAILPARDTGDPVDRIKTLIGTFRYPRLGPGMMWEAAAREVRDRGGRILMGRHAGELAFRGVAALPWRVSYTDNDGVEGAVEATHVISSAPLGLLPAALVPRPSAGALAAAARLRYRDFLTVALVLRPTKRFPDNWIYVHEPGVKVGRVQNFGNWSPEMVPDPDFACYGLEYFCFEGDGLWSLSDAELVDLGRRELATLGLAGADDVLDGCVVRQPKAYPVYDDEYTANVSAIRAVVERHYPGLHLVGRNGMHKYDNQDHAMMTGMLAARNILAGEMRYDVWSVTQDAEYLEAGVAGSRAAMHRGDSGLRTVPSRAAP